MPHHHLNYKKFNSSILIKKNFNKETKKNYTFFKQKFYFLLIKFFFFISIFMIHIHSKAN